MQNHYLTDNITSLESLNNAFEAIFQNTLFDCTSSGNNYRPKASAKLFVKCIPLVLE